MADKKISDLTAASSLAAGDLFEIENTGGNSRKATVQLIADYLQSLGAVRRLHSSFTQTGNDANTNEKDLGTYALPANTLASDGQSIRMKAWGTLAANSNSKTVRLYFGGHTTSFTTSSATDVKWLIESTLMRYQVGGQRRLNLFSIGASSATGGAGSTVSTAAQDETTSLTLKVTGQSGTAAANNIVMDGLLIEFLP